jgi:hypothetical protein
MAGKSRTSILVACLPVVLGSLVACEDVFPSKPGRPLSISRERAGMGPVGTPTTGPLIGAVARRVAIRSSPSPTASPLGFVTAGAALGRSVEPLGREGCAAGWYSVSPRGYLCLDGQTTIEEAHPTLQARGLLANHQASLPYTYAMARRTLSLFEPDPKHQDGVRERGRLSKGSTFAIVGSWETLDDYDQMQRLALLTLGVFVPTRDIEPVKIDDAPGFAIDGAADRLPLGLPLASKISIYRFAGTAPTLEGSLSASRSIALTVKSRSFEGERYWLRPNDTYVAEHDVAVVRQRQEFPPFVTLTTRWIDIDLNQGVVVMYQGEQPSYVTRTRVRPSDSLERGTAWVRGKQITDLSSTAPPSDKVRGDYDSPWVIELDSGLTLRAAIGSKSTELGAMTRGLELYAEDAARLFRFVEPSVPEGWHAVIASDPRHEGSPIVLR